MSAKDDILEQVAEKYLLHQGYFVQHNLTFRPRADHPDFVSHDDAKHGDIGILGFHPLKQGIERVVAIGCKNWQAGFNPQAELNAITGNRIVSGREGWKAFRELVVPKWSEAFRAVIHQHTGAEEFTYITAATRVIGDRAVWEAHPLFQAALGGNPLRVIDLADMLRTLLPEPGATVANTSIGGLQQLIKAAGIEFRL